MNSEIDPKRNEWYSHSYLNSLMHLVGNKLAANIYQLDIEVPGITMFDDPSTNELLESGTYKQITEKDAMRILAEWSKIAHSIKPTE